MLNLKSKLLNQKVDEEYLKFKYSYEKFAENLKVMEAYKEVAKRYQNALRSLAKR